VKLLSRVILATLLVLPAMAQQLAPTGTLRATFLGGNPVQGRVDAKTGAVSGPVEDLTRELAKRLGVPFAITPGAGVRAVIDAIKNHTADIGFLAYDATRAMEVDFSQPYSLGFNTYMVAANSPIRTVPDADRKGIRIGMAAGDAGELDLSRTLKNAELKRVQGGSVEEAVRMLTAGEVDAYGANKQRLSEVAARTPNVRILDDNFFGVEQSIVVAKGDAASLTVINKFIDDARSSGLIQGAISRAKLVGVEVAPPKGK
jgi:polar amino acid transport system substrate-binding protein